MLVRDMGHGTWNMAQALRFWVYTITGGMLSVHIPSQLPHSILPWDNEHSVPDRRTAGRDGTLDSHFRLRDCVTFVMKNAGAQVAYIVGHF